MPKGEAQHAVKTEMDKKRDRKWVDNRQEERQTAGIEQTGERKGQTAGRGQAGRDRQQVEGRQTLSHSNKHLSQECIESWHLEIMLDVVKLPFVFH